MTRRLCLKLALATLAPIATGCASSNAGANRPTRAQVLAAMTRANDAWQRVNAAQQWAFWDVAAYHTGNLAAHAITPNAAWLAYSTAWAEHNRWRGAASDRRGEWKYSYGETEQYVLFGDWQVCFQSYIDLYQLDGRRDPRRIARAREVMEYQMATPNQDYWWWADGIYMVMPVMTKLYHATGERRYLDKLHDYFRYADELMVDLDAGLYFRDAKYLYPKHRSSNGGKDFWARGNGWVFAALARTLADLPLDHASRPLLLDRFTRMAAALKPIQQADGYWTRSLLDPAHAPGPETSGTAFFTYAYAWGINHGLLERATFEATTLRAWRFLSEDALQPDGRLGYVQPIGERAIPGQVVDRNSTAPFGVGAFLLAASEMARLSDA